MRILKVSSSSEQQTGIIQRNKIMIATNPFQTQTRPFFELLDTPVKVTRTRKPTVSVVIPTMNEEQNLPYVLPYIPEIVDEVIIVDGRSKDRTVEVARELRPDVKIVKQTGKSKGNALRAGFAAATCDIIVMLDADGSTDPREIPAYVGALMAGAGFAKGAPFMQGGGTADSELLRRMGNWGLTMVVRVLFTNQYSDLCYGYNAFWKRVLPKLHLDSDGFEIETQMNVRAIQAKLRITEVPSFESERVFGESHLQTWRDGFRVLKTIGREWFKFNIAPTLAALSDFTA